MAIVWLGLAGAVVVVGCLGGMVYQAVAYDPEPQSSDSVPARGPFPWGMVLNWAVCAILTGVWGMVDLTLKAAGKPGLEPVDHENLD